MTGDETETLGKPGGPQTETEACEGLGPGTELWGPLTGFETAIWVRIEPRLETGTDKQKIEKPQTLCQIVIIQLKILIKVLTHQLALFLKITLHHLGP